jgi:hypothetical protein
MRIETMIETSAINRIKRVIATIAANTEATSPGPWYMSHGHVISPGEYTKGGADFDVCKQPWNEKDHTVYGINPGMSGRNDMRHIATCEPSTMKGLVKDVTRLLEERENVVELAALIADLLGNTMGADDSDDATRLLAAAEAYVIKNPE